MAGETNPGRKIERAPTLVTLPEDIAQGFLEGSIPEQKPLVHEDTESRIWGCFEQEVEVPSIGKALLRVDYRQFDGHMDPPERFDQMRFDYLSPQVDSSKGHELIAEMHWYVEKGPSTNPYPFDLMMVHRYVVPAYRDHRGVGRHLYQQAESWAQQVANKRGQNLTLALSTDQPLTMVWAEGLGYTPYPEEEARRQEALEHPERFDLVTESDSKGQIRNPALRREGKGHRIWFRKVLVAATAPGDDST